MINYELSNINLFGFIFTLTMGILMLFLPRRLAVFPLLMTACFITLGQVVNIAGLHFTMFRIIIFFGLARIIVRKEVFSIKWHQIDKMLIIYVITSAAVYVLLRNGSGEAFINQLGFINNSLFVYIVLRALIRDWDDIHTAFIIIALIFVPLAVAMIIEKTTGRNLFSVFGGVPEFTVVRDGRLRCQGPFLHPIMAGTVGATSLPFMLALWFSGNGKKMIAGIGIISVTIIAGTSGTSSALMTYIFVILGFAMWRLRDSMRAVRWFMFLSLIGLQIIMKGNVWELIGKSGEIIGIGGSGWHRVMLIDAAISHFNEWWLLGTDFTRHWMPTGVSWSEKHTDITNQFIRVGIDGGIVSVILFTSIIVICFRNIGIKLKEISSAGFPVKFTLWSMGVVLVAHLVSFTSVSYFDQIVVFWYLLLALITTASMIPVKNILTKSPDDLPNSKGN